MSLSLSFLPDVVPCMVCSLLFLQLTVRVRMSDGSVRRVQAKARDTVEAVCSRVRKYVPFSGKGRELPERSDAGGNIVMTHIYIYIHSNA